MIGRRPSVELPNEAREKIRARRTELGLTVAAFAAEVGCDSAHLSKVELGTARPSPALFSRICEKLWEDVKPAKTPREDTKARLSAGQGVGHRAGPRRRNEGTLGAEQPTGTPATARRQGEASVADPLDQIQHEFRVGMQSIQSSLEQLQGQIRRLTHQVAELVSERSEPLPSDLQPSSSSAATAASESSETMASVLAMSSGIRRPRTVDEAVHRAITLIESAQDQPFQGDDSAIGIIFFGDEIFARRHSLRTGWFRALRNALNSGLSIVHIERPDAGSAAMTARYIIELSGARGRYELHAMPLSEPDSMGHVVIVPGVGAVQISFKGPAAELEATHMPPDRDDYEALQGRFQQLCAEGTPQLRIYRPFSFEFREAVVELEKRRGERCLLMNGLSEVTIPHDINVERANSIADPIDRAQAHILVGQRRKRAACFHEQIKTYHFRDICPKPAIRDLVYAGRFPADDMLTHWKAAPITREQGKACVRAMINLLTDNPKYELGLLDEATDMSRELFYLVKKNRGVVMETWSRGPGSHLAQVDLEQPVQVGIEISSTSLATAIQEQFEGMWDSDAVTKDKEAVITWLRELLG